MTEGSAGAESYVAILELSAEISRAWNVDAFTAAVALAYVGIDTMALLSCPLGQAEQTKNDFLAWVDTYLQADSASDYQYEAADLYPARCGLPHSYGSLAKDHRKSRPPVLLHR